MVDVDCPIIRVRQQQVVQSSCFVAQAFISDGFVTKAGIVRTMLDADNGHDVLLGLKGYSLHKKG